MRPRPRVHATPASGPRGYPLVGHAPAFLRDRLGFLLRCAARYGPVVRLKIGEPTLLLNDPEDVRHVLAANPTNYDKTPRMTSPRGRRLSGEGLLTSSGSAHLRQRRLLQPVFARRVVDSLAGVVTDSASRLLAAWAGCGDAPINVADDLMALAQRITMRSVFGSSLPDEDRLADAITVRRRYMEHMFFSLFPFPEHLPASITRQYPAALRRIDAAIERGIADRRGIAEPRGDLLSLLMAARYDDGTGMTDRQVRDEALTLLVTGYETVGEALSWTWYLLARHPDAAARLVAEVDRVLDGRVPRAEDVQRLPYAGMVLAESMRLYPPTWIFVRMARRDDTLPSGAAVPAGSKVYLCPYVMHRHPVYFPEPERFDPERFSEAGRRGRPQFAYFPFGGGPRICIGEALARMEGALVIAMVAQRCRLELVAGQTIVPEPRMTLRPRNGVLMRVHERESWPS